MTTKPDWKDAPEWAKFKGLDMGCGPYIIRLWATPTRRWNR